MSFLNSVLSSIGGSGGQLLSPTTETPSSTFRKPPANSSSKRIAQNLSQDVSSGVAKRKADDGLSAPKDKTMRPSVSSGGQSQKLSNTPKIQASTTMPAKPHISSSGALGLMPYRGTSKTGTVSPIPARAEPKAPPKKGSYAEIMARAKASQTASAHVGIIKHKPKEKLSKKEQIALAKGLTLKTKQNPKDPARANSSDPNKTTSPHTPDAPPTKARSNGAPSSSKKPAQPSYTGTAKSKPTPSYKGTMKPLPPPSLLSKQKPTPRDTSSDERSHPRSRSTSVTHASSKHRPRPPNTTTTTDEDADEEEEEEEEEMDSDLSDMEAGFSDVEQEDERALKAAKREDQFEAMMERELKRQKERKRREAGRGMGRAG
ncbi:Chromatin SPT2 [Lasallia pustulata]|uniref:Chromatin SPT2 n=1 Tax=Lasallia pustulata TaxID=136370 RepID=A0A1W5DCD8_9LECA|nr:Chromatin SPT2 [Lasallia pustulata]